MNHVWCHGPECHTYATQDRVRGTKGSKVLRTRKVRHNPDYSLNFYNYFCSNGCYNDFAHKYVEQVIRIAPRTTPLETPIEVREETQVRRWDGHEYKTKVIDKLSNVG
tara:strand:+ start:328 stop:651 length:324 start_codon:yes stop_codon:yes gene_type:complete